MGSSSKVVGLLLHGITCYVGLLPKGSFFEEHSDLTNSLPSPLWQVWIPQASIQ